MLGIPKLFARTAAPRTILLIGSVLMILACQSDPSARERRADAGGSAAGNGGHDTASSTGGGADRDAAGSGADGAPSTPTNLAVDGMCSEHGVVEAVCTKCNPMLIPIFQAKGDWCVEHEFPESFCPICHPELGGRPAVDVATDEAPADGTRIKFATKEVAARVGIDTTTATRGEQASAIIATARVVADASRSASVSPSASGVVRTFLVDLGARVAKGTPLATLDSPNVAEDRARLDSARARVEATEANYEREKQLSEKGVSSLKEMQAAQQAWEEAKADLAAATAAVGVVGGVSAEGGAYTIRAPIPGVVTARNYSVGTRVEPGQILFDILDTSILWAEIDIPESQALHVSVGQTVSLEIDGLADRRFDGTIQYVAPVVDAQTRTVRARAALDNASGELRANMYARAHISIASSGGDALIPRSAVQEAKGVQLVFVPLAVDEYEARRVRTAPSDGDLVAVTAGLLPGEMVVTTGSFLLKTETLKGSIGAGCCEVETPK